MNYKEYWWKCTKETLNTFGWYLMVIGSFAGMVCLCGLLAFLGIKCIEFLIPIFGEIISFIILIGLAFSGLYIIFIIFDYRYYKKKVVGR